MQISEIRSDVIAEFPASASQRRFWYLHQLDPQSVASNIAVHWDLHGACPAELIESAFRQIIDRHEILRTRFEERGGVLFQQVVEKTDFRLSTIDLRTISEDDHDSRIAGVAAELSNRPFDLGKPGHLRVALVRTHQDCTSILIAAHHAVFDGYSIGVMGHELGTILAASLSGQTAELPVLPLQYGDFSRWEEACADSGAQDQNQAYWQRQLGGAPYFHLPYDRPAKPLGKRPSGRINIPLNADFLDSLETTAREFQTSPFSVGAAVAAAVLHRVTGAEDISFGTTYAGRGEAELENLIGVFVNPVVLRMGVGPDSTLTALVDQAADTVRHALAHGDYPFDQIVMDQKPPRDATRTPLVSTLFSLQPVFLKERTYGPLSLQSIPSRTPAITHDIAINVTGRDAGWMIMIDYDVSRFNRRTVEAIGQLFSDTFESMFHQANLVLSDLPYEHPQPVRPRTITPKPASQAAPLPQSSAQDDTIAPRLRQIWGEILDRDPSACDGDFFDLGGHSLMVLRMLSQVGEVFGTRPGIADFLQSPTLQGFSAMIAGLIAPQTTDPETDKDDPFEIIWLKDGQPDAPLVLSVNQPFLYHNLARQLDDGIACANLHICDPAPLRQSRDAATLDQLVDQATRHALALAGDRPVMLLGQCVDGVMAYRIAQAMAEAGRPVDTLAMIDSWRPKQPVQISGMKRFRLRARAKARRVANYGGLLLTGQMGWTEFLTKSSLGKSLLMRTGKLDRPTAAEDQEWEVNGYLRDLVLTREFDAFEGDTLMFAPASQTRRAVTERFGWAAHLPADVPIYMLEGWHEDALLKNGTARIAEVIQARLNRAQRRLAA
ncbi:MAG: condensation domain-containing protein [Paracoccaceae bacterium]